MQKIMMVLVSGLFLAACHVNASAKIHFETRICRGCDYNNALAIAKALKPAISCVNNTDVFNPDTAAAQVCYATPVNVLVVDADSRKMWSFENTYIHQGQPLYNLTNEVTFEPQMPAAAVSLIHQLLDDYHQLHLWTVQIQQQMQAQLQSTAAARLSNNGECKDSDYAKALEMAFSIKKHSEIQLVFQSLGYANDSFLSHMQHAKMNGANFTVSNTGVSASGTWVHLPEPLTMVNVYATDNGQTQVAIDISVNSRSIVVSLNEDETYFDGLALNQLKGRTVSSSLISKCLADKLDSLYPKTVAGSGSANPSTSNVPLMGDGTIGTGGGVGGIGGGNPQTCKHTYYINGNEMASFEGVCP